MLLRDSKKQTETIPLSGTRRNDFDSAAAKYYPTTKGKYPFWHYKPPNCSIGWLTGSGYLRSEKQAFARYLDGRVSAVFGTHTHVPTADAGVLPGGTGFITDVGMTGPLQSVLGVRPEQAVAKMREKLPVRFAVADGACCMDAVLFTLDDATGHATSAERLRIT